MAAMFKFFLPLLFFLAFPLPAFPSPIFLPLRLLPPPSTTTTTSSSSSAAATTSYLANLAASSLTRARHLPSPNAPSLPLYPHSYGSYSLDLSLGTPPQSISLVLDTSADLVWVPCTTSYLCRNCSSPNPPRPFLPYTSSSSKPVRCRNPKCTMLHPTSSLSSCSTSTDRCPPYSILSNSGSTTGYLLTETLNLPSKRVSNFAIGCSTSSSFHPAGIAGFGRGPLALRAQLGLTKFGYCLLSRRFDDIARVHSSLVLGGGTASRLLYTPLLKNPAAGNRSLAFDYYIRLTKIIVGGKWIQIPSRYLDINLDGDRGTVIDSGITLTVMSVPVFDLVSNEFDAQLTRVYPRAISVEDETGLRRCYDLSAAGKNVSSLSDLKLPDFTLQFRGGAQMKLPLENYFTLLGPLSAVCLTMVSNGYVGPEQASGPSIIIGSYQQQNFYLEYDLENERLGFQPQNCRVGD